MTPVADALDGARLVKTDSRGVQTLVQVWHGGTTVNVYRTGVPANDSHNWHEINCWNLHGDDGRAPDRDEIEKRMGQHFEAIREGRV